jgi:hypothetical protein
MTDDREPPTGRRSRLEDEVLEILHRADRPPSPWERARLWFSRLIRPRDPVRRRSSRSLLRRFDESLWLPACLVCGIVAYFVSDTSPLLARILAVLATALVLLVIVRSLVRPNDSSVKQWRGRDVDFSPPGRPLWLDRVFRGPRRPPRP